ncbi:MAG: LacI family DNA-binding transcriptional regulator, partial [Propionibacteriaceae bacterium]|nr:LacI family DNA-binding transcriptional regulator [Propionibacteriaceae bacterium]
MRTDARRTRVTQADVARLAGVSQAAVSLALAGERTGRTRVGSEVRARILDAVAMTGYAIDPVARRLAGGTSSILGVFTYEKTFPTAGGDFYYPFLVGIERQAAALGLDLLLFTSSAVEGDGHRLLSSGLGRLSAADGVVLLGRHTN